MFCSPLRFRLRDAILPRREMTMGQAAERLQIIRDYLVAEYSPEEPPTESFVIADEHYVGRTFRWTDHRAVWFHEADELKVYGPEGHLVTKSVGDLAVASDNDDQVITLPMYAREPNQIPEVAARKAA